MQRYVDADLVPPGMDMVAVVAMFARPFTGKFKIDPFDPGNLVAVYCSCSYGKKRAEAVFELVEVHADGETVKAAR